MHVYISTEIAYRLIFKFIIIHIFGLYIVYNIFYNCYISIFQIDFAIFAICCCLELNLSSDHVS